MGEQKEYRFSAEKSHKFLDQNKVLEAILFVAQKQNNLYMLLKALFYADKYHLKHYGNLISDDSYFAPEDGPAPSGAYDLLKFVRGDGDVKFDSSVLDAIQKIEDNTIYVNRGPQIEHLSKSDIEALESAIELVNSWGPKKVWRESHKEPSYIKTYENNPNGIIPLKEIILDLDNGKKILEYFSS